MDVGSLTFQNCKHWSSAKLHDPKHGVNLYHQYPNKINFQTRATNDRNLHTHDLQNSESIEWVWYEYGSKFKRTESAISAIVLRGKKLDPQSVCTSKILKSKAPKLPKQDRIHEPQCKNRSYVKIPTQLLLATLLLATRASLLSATLAILSFSSYFTHLVSAALNYSSYSSYASYR